MRRPRPVRTQAMRSRWLPALLATATAAAGCAEGGLEAFPRTGADAGPADPSDPSDSSDPSDPSDPTDPSDPSDTDPRDTPPPVTVERGALELQVDSVTSSAVQLSWQPADGASGYEVRIAPEPSAAQDGTLGEPAVSVATLPAGASSHRLEGIAAGTDVFVRVEAQGADAFGIAHARTLGGPEASLDGALQAVHGFGPSTLLLVLANPETRFDGGGYDGDTGADWQGGSWTVERADGSTIGVSAVHRATRPVGQPDYPVGYDRYGDGDVVDLEHRIFLRLDEPIGERALLRVSHEGGGIALDVTVPFSDRYLVTPLIQVNQVGYNPQASRRWAYVSGWMGDGGGADLSGLPGAADVLVEPLDTLAVRGAEVQDLSVETRAEHDARAGGEVRQIDLSSVPAQEGARYRVHLPGVGVSWPTAVSEEASFKAFYVAARGLFHNRWCGDLGSDYTEWSRPEDHCSAYFVEGRSYEAGMFPESTPRTNERPVRGGHHDAGDFDLRPYHVVVAQYLLRAYEMAPDRFPDGQLTIPESGNGIPDLLDEGLWSVAAWEALQNPDGTIRAGVESHAHPRGVYHADADQLPYWTYDPTPWHTAYVAGVLAQASRLVRPYDASRADELEQAARSAYDSPITGSAPPSFRMYAASELFAATEESRFEGDFESLWAELDSYGGGAFDHFGTMREVYPGSFTGWAPAMADFVMGYAESPGADPAIVDTIHAEMQSEADGVAASILQSPFAHRTGLHADEPPDWGHAASTGRHGDVLYQALELGDLPEEARQRYIDALSVSADFALGCNPMGMSYMTGLGSRNPDEPLHLDTLAFLKEGMPEVPGIPIYGPVRSLPDVYYYDPVTAAFHPSFGERPEGKRVADSRTAVVSSEFTVWEMQAPFAELFASLAPQTMEPPDTWLPGGEAHRATLPEKYAE